MAAARLEGGARFLDFVSEGMARAAEQARDVLRTSSGPQDDAADPKSDRG
ncbi:hypothetical protein GCM10010264_40280 [Streptomyces globisporus]|nr:hypothetical protein GCM10010264_40280 [Streptomyces globisporus]